MPELPEVESFKSYFNHTALHEKVAHASVNDDGVLKDMSARSFQMRMKDETFKSSSRHGKYIFVELDRDETLVLHFGMTGKLKYYKDSDLEPDYARVVFELKNGYQLAYVCPRKFGKLELTKSKDAFIEEHELGPDAWLADLSLKEFKELIREHTGRIKTTLMNQKTIAGLGNDYSDEILFHAKIYPLTNIDELDDDALKEIHHQLKKILKKTIDVHAAKEKYPDNYLFLHRKDGEKCPICGGEIVRKKYSGRSYYYCSKHQKKQ